MYRDRRQSERIPSRILLSVKLLNTQTVWRVLATNVSASGVSFEIEEPLKPTAQLDLEIKLPDRAAPLLVTGEVVWSRPGTRLLRGEGGKLSEHREVGVKFVRIAPEDQRLLRLYARLNAPPEALG